MKPYPQILCALLASAVVLPMPSRAMAASGMPVDMSGMPFGQSFVSGGTPISEDSVAAAPSHALPAAAAATSDAPDSSLFADGTKAINESRWTDAVTIFTTIAGEHSEHTDGALYWKAYAEAKLGQSASARQSCAELRSAYPNSRWIDDCGALEIEMLSIARKPIEIESWQSDDVKLLALNAMMRQDENRALAEIQAILNGDSSEKLKKEAQFILGQHYSNATYAQIVRISYVEGDVRIQRGEPAGLSKGKTNAEWETAAANLPLETGFSLVTGEDGRAEIEFENASTIYLGENSILTFNDLHTTEGVPYTELALLSGTVSLHVHPYVAGERFMLRTPIQDLLTSKASDMRVEAFADALTLTSLDVGEMHLAGRPPEVVQPGRTWICRPGQLWAEQGQSDADAFKAWDQWVADRVHQRDAAIASVMQASGLTTPIPGMAEMAGQGKFFDCAPYGTCWEPNPQPTPDETAAYPANSRPRFELASFHLAMVRRYPAQLSDSAAPQTMEMDLNFPCMPAAVRYRMMKDPVTGRQIVVEGRPVSSKPYEWAVCHAGTWLHHKKHYVWCAGTKRHHIDPVRWVKSERRVGFVPLHPYDVKGQPAINTRHVVFEVGGKDGGIVTPVRFGDRPIEFLKEAPKEFRNSPMRPLAQAGVPRMEAHVFETKPSNKGWEVSRASVPIHFEPKTQTFMISKEQEHGGKSATAFAPMTNHSGNLQARGGSFEGANGFHGSSGGGTGGSHSSSGGGSTAASSSSSSSSAAASSGGSHH